MTAQAAEDSVHNRVRRQFGSTAAAYTTSAGHSDQTALQSLVDLARPQASDTVLDIATGAGHTALAFAPHVRQVVACDLTDAMLAETEKNAAARGLTNVLVRRASAEHLPFPDGEFDLATVRLASHHFADNAAAVREMARVVRPGGRVLIVDNYGPEDEALDALLQRMETLRDPSHVRSYRLSVWKTFIADAGLNLERVVTDHYSDQPRGMNFNDWVRRSKTPAESIAELRTLFAEAPPAFRELLKVVADGDELWFQLPQVTLLATR